VRGAVAALVSLVTLSLVTFVATSYKSAEEVARSALGQEVTDEQLRAYVESRGLDRPLVHRYLAWLGDVARGDLGTSPVTGRAVWDEIQPRLSRTVCLSVLALLLAIPTSVALGLFMARRAGRPSDIALLVGTVVIAALPEFVIGIGLLMVFAVVLGWLPVSSAGVSVGSPATQAVAYVLPALTLALAMLPHVARVARVAVAEVLAAPYVQAAMLRGLSSRTVLWDYAMRNAAVPLLNVVALNIVYVLGGVVVVENVFAFPGIGQALVSAIGSGDAITVQAIVLIKGTMIIGLSWLTDLLAIYFNPRLRATTA
jgi:peptide/nickel transport system permease protein